MKVAGAHVLPGDAFEYEGKPWCPTCGRADLHGCQPGLCKHPEAEELFRRRREVRVALGTAQQPPTGPLELDETPGKAQLDDPFLQPCEHVRTWSNGALWPCAVDGCPAESMADTVETEAAPGVRDIYVRRRYRRPDGSYLATWVYSGVRPGQ